MQSAVGFPVTITMTHDEALKLLADLAARLAMRVNPPKPPKAERVEGGIDFWPETATEAVDNAK